MHFNSSNFCNQGIIAAFVLSAFGKSLSGEVNIIGLRAQLFVKSTELQSIGIIIKVHPSSIFFKALNVEDNLRRIIIIQTEFLDLFIEFL